MKLNKAALRELGIVSSFEVLRKAGNRVYVFYRPGSTSQAPAWIVSDGTFAREFPIAPPVRENKEDALTKARTWAEERFDLLGLEWERDPWGSYHPKGTLSRCAYGPRAQEIQHAQA